MKNKILIIRFSSIGDIVLTTPVIRNIFNAGHEVHYLTKKSFASILQSNSKVAKVYSIVSHVDECIQALKDECYDHVIDLHNNFRSGIIKRKLSAPSSSFKKLNIQKWLLTSFHINILPDVHIVDRYNATLSKLNIPCDNLGLEYHIPEQDEIKINEYGGEKSYHCLAIGAAHFTKQIPKQLAIEILNKLNYPVVIIGGPDDVSKAEEIVIGTSNNKVISLCGKLNFHQSASVIRQSQGIITPDTGMMHIAAALQIPIVSIWGNTVPDFGMYPYRGSIEGKTKVINMEVSDLNCRPCSKIGYKECPKKHFKCMLSHDAQQISDVIVEISLD